jgi:hypothetical protein
MSAIYFLLNGSLTRELIFGFQEVNSVGNVRVRGKGRGITATAIESRR